MTLNLKSFQQSISPYTRASRWLVAYSGGVDSHLLLQTLVELKAENPDWPKIEAVHVNHQLQAEADEWAQYCQLQCDKLNIPLLMQAVTIEDQPRTSLEQLAREQRYQFFVSIMTTKDILMMGHHQDDQVETALLRLLRGSGSKGLAAMPKTRRLGEGRLLRPLLEYSRDEIEKAAVHAGLQWIEDPSNQQTQFDRNFLRLNVLPQLEDRWPGHRQTIARACQLSDEAAQLNEDLAYIDADSLQLDLSATAWPIALLRQLSPLRQKNLIRLWLSERNLPTPSASQLHAVLIDVLEASLDAQPVMQWGGIEVRRFNDELVIIPMLPAFDPNQEMQWHGEAWQLPASGNMTVEVEKGAGLRPQEYTVRFRKGGERCRPVGRQGSQTLKKLFQEYQVPVWLRDRIPLLYSANNELAAVAGYWVCEGFQVEPGEEGWAVSWQPESLLGAPLPGVPLPGVQGDR